MMAFVRRLFADQETNNIIAIATVTLIGSMQLLIMIALVFSYIPMPSDEFAHHMFAVYATTLRPEREMSFYHFFVFFAMGLQVVVLGVLRQRLADGELGKKILRLIYIEGFWLCLELFAVFKIFLYGNPTWARYLLFAVIGLSIFSKIFWPEFNKAILWVQSNALSLPQHKLLRQGCMVLVCIFIVSVFYIGDMDRALACMMIWGNLDQFHQWRLQNSWGVGAWSDLDYLSLLMGVSMAYCITTFLMLRFWLNSLLLAGSLTLLLIKWQFFHAGVAPIIWQYPQRIAPGYCLDLILFILLLVSLRWDKRLLSRLALVGLGFEVFRYVAISMGVDTIPMYAPLLGRQFFAFAWQFVIPIVYVTTLIVIGLTAQRQQLDIFIISVCVYGLAVFGLHVRESSLSNYDTVSLPLAMLLGFWAKHWCDKVQLERAVVLKLSAAFLSVMMLTTNNLFMVYPNIFNIAQLRWDQVKIYYQQHQGNVVK